MKVQTPWPQVDRPLCAKCGHYHQSKGWISNNFFLLLSLLLLVCIFTQPFHKCILSRQWAWGSQHPEPDPHLQRTLHSMEHTVKLQNACWIKYWVYKYLMGLGHFRGWPKRFHKADCRARPWQPPTTFHLVDRTMKPKRNEWSRRTIKGADTPFSGQKGSCLSKAVTKARESSKPEEYLKQRQFKINSLQLSSVVSVLTCTVIRSSADLWILYKRPKRKWILCI